MLLSAILRNIVTAPTKSRIPHNPSSSSVFSNALTRILDRWTPLSGSECYIRFGNKQAKYILSTNVIVRARLNENRASALDYESRML